MRADARAKTRLAEAVFGGRYSNEEQMKLSEITKQFRIDGSSALRVLKTFKL
jgi:hypothetical protein